MSKKILSAVLCAGALFAATISPVLAAPDAAIAPPRLIIKKSAQCKKMPVANQLKCVFSFTITNNGPGSFTGPILLTDTLNLPAKFLTYTTGGGVMTCSPAIGPTSTLSCTIPVVTIPFSNSISRTITAVVVNRNADTRQCVTITRPVQTPPSTACIPFNAQG